MAGKKKFQKSTRPASVLALMVFALVLLLLSGVGVLSIGETARVFSVRTATDIAARSAADSGITKALWTMNRKLKAGTWDGDPLWQWYTTLPNSDAVYRYIAIKAMKLYGDILPSGNDDLIDFILSASWKEGDFVIKSVGKAGGAQKAIYAIVRLKGLADAGVLVRSTLTLKEGTLVDGRDSRDPDNLDPDVLVEIGTTSTANGAVTLNNGVVVEGNLLVGVGGIVDDVIKDLGAATGLRYPFPEEPKFPEVFPPVESDDFKYYDTAIFIPNKDPNVLYVDESWNGRYTQIDLESSVKTEKLIVKSGHDVVLHLTNTGPGLPNASISLGVGCEIIIEDGATLTLYVDGDVLSGNNSGFNNLGTPPDLKIWGNWRGLDVPQLWRLNAKSEQFGQVYAPNADLTVNNSGDLYGAFTANSFIMMNGGNLFYDGALSDVSPGDEGLRFVIKRWHEE